jgi:TonB family protein
MELLIYVGKVSLYWTLFFICYRLLLRRHTFFVWNRLYLIGSLVLSFALPFIIYPPSAPAIPVFYEVSASTFTVAAESDAYSVFNLTNFLWLVYAAGTSYAAYKLLNHFRQLRGFLKDGEQIDLDDCTVILIDSNQIGSFSFLKWIVVNRNDYEHHFDAILRHEMVHTKQWHSADILLLEILKVAFWFNPVLLLYKQSIQEVHEFLADSEAPNRENYAHFLVAYALNAPVASLTNHFFKPSQIKTRIQMIYKNRTSKWMLGSYMIALTAIGITALVVAGCEQNEQSDLLALKDKSSEMKKSVADLPTPGKIFSVVEEQPEFPGGTSAMYKFLGQNIKYPEAASRANVSGRVFLSFVVTQTGDIQDIMVLKGIGFGCDAEAIRVLKSFPKWEPGKQDGVPVNVRYNLPINFQLEDGSPVKSPAETSVNLRTGDKKPLIIIDGEIMPEQDLSKIPVTKEIESVNVIKDKTAVEKYGERAKDGVVLVTTQRK